MPTLSRFSDEGSAAKIRKAPAIGERTRIGSKLPTSRSPIIQRSVR